ncbi:MAG: DUF4169 family protein [Alphaproteobacteria bacterium]
MADLINLRKARKKKARAEKSAKASENRLQHGRTKSDKQKTATINLSAIKRLDGKRLDD